MIMLNEKTNWSCASAATPSNAKKESDYDEVYKLSLELCNDPETANRVAARFIEDVRTSQEALTDKETSDEK